MRSRPFYTHFQTFNKTICVIVSVADLFLSGIIEKCSSSDTAARENQSKFVFIRARVLVHFLSMTHARQHVRFLCDSITSRSLKDEDFAAWVIRIGQQKLQYRQANGQTIY